MPSFTSNSLITKVCGLTLCSLILSSLSFLHGNGVPPNPFGSGGVSSKAANLFPPDPFGGIGSGLFEPSYRGSPPTQGAYRGDSLPAASSLIPYRTSWEYATILNYRPADGLTASVNPPRFSWPYLPGVVAEDYLEGIPPTVFTLQLSRDPAFSDSGIVIKDTTYNFYNALPVLEPGEWYWRVGYGRGEALQWNNVRSFLIGEDTPKWDRTVINRAVKILSQAVRPRTAPAGGWPALREMAESDPATKQTYEQLTRFADDTLSADWWSDFPESDRLGRPPANREEQTRFIRILKACTNVAYLYRLTGDPKYRPAIGHVVEMASWPQGGLLSPEGGLGGITKMPSQAAELFAVVYDWFGEDLSPEDRATLKEGIRWRLDAMYFHPDNIIWQQGDATMRHYGLAYVGGSHPYQNFAWTVPAILLMAGEMEEADRLVPLALNYLTGVTAPDGPDEGYNEGHGYSNEKAGTLLSAALVTDMLLPQLEIGKNPPIYNLIDWFVMLFPGAEQLPWGDSWLSTANGVGGHNLRMLTYLTGSPVAKHFWKERAQGKASDNPYGLYSRAWFEFGSYRHYAESVAAIDETEAEPKETLFLPEAGWLFTQSMPIRNFSDYFKAIGMQFQMRPRGGYGHSYASDGSFSWYAYGQILSSGGGWRSWASLLFSRSPTSHNSLLINGQGHRLTDPYRPKRALAARPLAFAEDDRSVYWAADLTEGYRYITEVERVHRHVLFLDKKWFLIVDDLALGEAADPATFSWLFHVYQKVPVALKGNDPVGFDYSVGRTLAKVRFANLPETVTLENREGREGYVNPLTGEDFYPEEMERARSRGIFKKYITADLMQNNLWMRTAEAHRKFVFFSILAAGDAKNPLPEIRILSEKRIEIVDAEGRSTVVSIDPAEAADIVIDLDSVRAHAKAAEAR